MTCTHTTKSHSADNTSTDIVTYRYEGQLVYVPVAPDYNQALSHARDAFPQLKGVRDASLSLCMPGRAPKPVGISPAAWPKLIAHMSRYQIIDVQITSTHTRTVPIPSITITYADAEDAVNTDPAPPYSGSDGARVEDEKKSRSSPRTLHTRRSWFFQKLHGQ